jgi:hypothetical protein
MGGHRGLLEGGEHPAVGVETDKQAFADAAQLGGEPMATAADSSIAAW